MSSLATFSSIQLNKLRQQQDPSADAVIATYAPHALKEMHEVLGALKTNADLLPAETKVPLQLLYQDIIKQHTLIEKAVWDNGFHFFSRHASDIMLLLGFLSLPYCYAAANGAEVLVRSKRIMADPEKRLLETAEFVFDVMAPHAFTAEGKGLVAILKVRLMHAMSRWFVIQSEGWDSKVYGPPINQEDMAGTNLAFSLIVTRGLKKLGQELSSEEVMMYVRYWNGIGAMLGVTPALLPNTAKAAYVLERNIRERHFRASEAGQKLTAVLLTYFRKATIDSPFEGQSDAFVAFLLGEEMSKMLGVQTSTLQSLRFEPYQFLLQFQHKLGLQKDSYGKAFQQFKNAWAKD